MERQFLSTSIEAKNVHYIEYSLYGELTASQSNVVKCNKKACQD